MTQQYLSKSSTLKRRDHLSMFCLAMRKLKAALRSLAGGVNDHHEQETGRQETGATVPLQRRFRSIRRVCWSL